MATLEDRAAELGTQLHELMYGAESQIMLNAAPWLVRLAHIVDAARDFADEYEGRQSQADADAAQQQAREAQQRADDAARRASAASGNVAAPGSGTGNFAPPPTPAPADTAPLPPSPVVPEVPPQPPSAPTLPPPPPPFPPAAPPISSSLPDITQLSPSQRADLLAELQAQQSGPPFPPTV